MDLLSGRTILVISPQSWGKMFLSKHHYALELARRGNTVYFLNPPDNSRWTLGSSGKRITVRPSGIHPGLWLIDQQLFFPYLLKFHFRAAFDWLMRRQLQGILSAIPTQPDLLWSFDLGNFFPLPWFGKQLLKVFHPVDEPADGIAIKAGTGADILFSVTREILEKYAGFRIPSFFVNHGLAEEFLTAVERSPESDAGRSLPVRAGLSGNLVRPDLDRPTLMRLITANPGTEFHFYGSYTAAQSNIGGSAEATGFIRDLQSQPNVRLLGVLSTTELATALNTMDILLICYDLRLDQSRGTNYHKVLEYLSTGKVIVANNITTYQERPDLVCMIAGRENNDTLPSLFGEVLNNLDHWNRTELAVKRKNFALENTYRRQLDRINELMIRNIPTDRLPVIH